MKKPFSLSPSILIAMAASSFDVDTIVPQQTEGALPPVSAAGMGILGLIPTCGSCHEGRRCVDRFTDWPAQWDTKEPKMCICHKKVTSIKKTAHLTTMESNHHRWLLFVFVTGNGIAWVRDGSQRITTPHGGFLLTDLWI